MRRDAVCRVSHVRNAVPLRHLHHASSRAAITRHNIYKEYESNEVRGQFRRDARKHIQRKGHCRACGPSCRGGGVGPGRRDGCPHRRLACGCRRRPLVAARHAGARSTPPRHGGARGGAGAARGPGGRRDGPSPRARKHPLRREPHPGPDAQDGRRHRGLRRAPLVAHLRRPHRRCPPL